MAEVAVLAAIRANEEKVAEEELPRTFLSGTGNCEATTFGAVSGPTKGKHGTVLFLAWNKDYTPKRRNVGTSGKIV